MGMKFFGNVTQLTAVLIFLSHGSIAILLEWFFFLLIVICSSFYGNVFDGLT